MKSERMVFGIWLMIVFLPFTYGQKKTRQNGVGEVKTVAKATNQKEMVPLYLKAYQEAVKYGDATAAISFLYLALAADPSLTHLKDSIATLYFVSRRFSEGIQIGEEILQRDPNNQNILEIVAMSYLALGNLKQALASYEKLYTLTKNLYHLYQIASLQYQLDRFTECRLTVAQLVNDPASGQQPISIILENGQQIQVPTKAAAYNLLGALYMKQREYDEAEGAFLQALAIQEDFLLPKSNLELLKKLREEKH